MSFFNIIAGLLGSQYNPVVVPDTDAVLVAKQWADNGGQSTSVKNAVASFINSIDVIVDDPNDKTILEKIVALWFGVGNADGAALNVIDPADDDSAFRISYNNGTMTLGTKGFQFGAGVWCQTHLLRKQISGFPEITYGFYTQDYLVGGFISDGNVEITWPYDTDTNTYIRIQDDYNHPISNPSGNKKGLWTFSRNGDYVERWQNGIKTGFVSSPVDVTAPNGTERIGYAGAPYTATSAQITMMFYAMKFTDAEQLAFKNALITLMQALNMEVTP